MYLEVETKNNEDVKLKEVCSNHDDNHSKSPKFEDVVISSDQVSRLQGDGKKRGAKDLKNDDESNEYPQKSHKCDIDEITFESTICDTSNDMMELDESQQELFKATYKENLQRYDVKNVAINKFLEAMSKQQQRSMKNEVINQLEGSSEISGQEQIVQDFISTNSKIPIESSVINETTSMNTTMIQIEDVGAQIVTNTLITIQDQCESNEQGISNLMYDEDHVKGWNFRRGLQERLLLKEVTNAEKRNAEIAIEVNGTNNESNVQSTRPVIWGTCKYRDLWAIAVTIDEDVHMDNTSPIPLDEVMDDGLDNVNFI